MPCHIEKRLCGCFCEVQTGSSYGRYRAVDDTMKTDHLGCSRVHWGPRHLAIRVLLGGCFMVFLYHQVRVYKNLERGGLER